MNDIVATKPRNLRPRAQAPVTLTTLKAGSAARVELGQPRNLDNTDAWLGIVHGVDAVAVKLLVVRKRMVVTTRTGRRTHRQYHWLDMQEPSLIVIPWTRIATILLVPDKPRGGRPVDVVDITDLRAVAERKRVSA